jgi:hypothetical protein
VSMARLSIFVFMSVIVFGYYGNNSLSAKTEVNRSECYNAIADRQRFIIWHDLNTVYSFIKPYVFYAHNGQVYQFRTDSSRSLICYKFEAVAS